MTTFYVKEHYLLFTHWVAIKFQPALVMQAPPGPGPQQLKNFTCLPKP